MTNDEQACAIENCDSLTLVRKGWCSKHYQRWRTHGDPLGGTSRYSTPEKAFTARVDKNGPNGCWLWTGTKLEDGYGQFNVDGRHTLVHRFSWELHNGPIPKSTGYHGTCVLHKCDTPSCVNPDHLFLGTQKNNVADMIFKGRDIKARGETHGKSKLTNAKVAAISADLRPHIEIAIDYGISRNNVSVIKRHETWRHVA